MTARRTYRVQPELGRTGRWEVRYFDAAVGAWVQHGPEYDSMTEQSGP